MENNIYPNCSIKVLEHPMSTESVKDSFTNPGLIKHTILDGALSKDEKSMDQSFLIKVGGNPRLIQNEDYYFTKFMEESFSFLFQVDEDVYPKPCFTMITVILLVMGLSIFSLKSGRMRYKIQ
ncbi:hypothetical protein [Paenibacillus radicis (ex Gao et al. 2016)]|uniref:hypothetical protein n=1 Tax=Paenibacillus radicis (ex Gao et al. 2016) TaxID=1737354 RepID=UPI001E323861